ncbi:MAG: glycine cleavage system aminomethyltransferase GcvT [Pigmentiphaga sp.]|uniref:glycine cleavage system aminomethyltransferase GcvT n=1 Tax=Pigmentiphaga sp. TaxID=1977564 RepID=UPI0029A4182B|nr:glycine cleavage system aminomethyltransferase GcvT [Pigmentiphaga sp.]MDX3906582.1 glycine cleavage system aminomethyltransferase GcvT [Pigmentiphaga sp.]
MSPTPVPRQTPLFAEHLALAARMVDFGGWSLPVSYGSQIEEHHAVRRDAGMFDVSHMLNVDVTGSQARAYLRYLLANDVERLSEPGKALYSCMLNPQGGVVDDLIAYLLTPEHYRLVVNAASADKDLVWMARVAQAGGYDVVIEPRRELAMIAVQGPSARERLAQARPGLGALARALRPFAAEATAGTLVARTGYTGEDGVEIVLPAAEAAPLWRDLLAAGVVPCGLGARDTLRIEAGLNLYGQDMDELTQPAEAGLAWTVSDHDPQRDFVGRAALAFGLKWQLLGVRLLDRGVMRAHMPVHIGAGQGMITSGTMSPTVGTSIGFARVPESVAPGDRVEVEIRGRRLPAVACRLPFVRHGRLLEGAGP